MAKYKIIIGTRGSKLALWQAEWVKSELERLNPEINIELKKIKTTGDKILDVPLAQVGGKGLFVKEIEEALHSGKADMAVHSMKDVPTEFPEGLHLSVICKREDQRDAFISQQSAISSQQSAVLNFRELPQGAVIGTSSLRRSCQLLSIRPDLKIVQLRGNLDTRIRKLDEGQFDAIILAVAGLKRLGWAEKITEILEPEIILPAIGQGAIGIECRIDDEFTNKLIAPLNHPETSICVKAERAFLKRLEGGCQVPIAGYARIEHGTQNIEDKKLRRWEDKKKIEDKNFSGSQYHNSSLNTDSLLIMDGLVGSISGDSIIRAHSEGKPEDAEILGIKVAEDLLSKGADEILAEVYGR